MFYIYFLFFWTDIRTTILIVITFLLSLLARQIFTKPAPNRSLPLFESITDAITWQSITRLTYGNQISTTLLPVTGKPYFASPETKVALGPFALPSALVSNSNVLSCANKRNNVRRGHQRTCSEQSVPVTSYHVSRGSCDQSVLATTTKEKILAQSPEKIMFEFKSKENAADSVWLCFIFTV